MKRRSHTDRYGIRFRLLGLWLILVFMVIPSVVNASSSWAKLRVQPPPDAFVGSIVYGNGKWLALGWDVALWYAHETETWTSESIAGLVGFDALYLESQNTWVVVGWTYAGTALAVKDGNKPWDMINTGTDNLYAVATDGTKIVAGSDGMILSTSVTALPTWNSTTANLVGTSWLDVTYGNGKFVAVGLEGVQGGRVRISSNGENWDEPTSLPDNLAALRGVAFGGGKFVAVGNDRTIITSADGEIWSRASDVPAGLYRSVVYDGREFVAAGDQGIIITSVDGDTWSEALSDPSAGDFFQVSYGGGKWMAVTLAGQIWTKAPSNNADLTNLVVSAGSLTFAPGTTSYTLTVPNDVDNLTVTPTTDDDAATVTVNNNALGGDGSVTVPLSVGANTINVVVTAENGTKKTYQLTVKRQLSAPVWTGANSHVDSAELQATSGDAQGTWKAVFEIYSDSSYTTRVKTLNGDTVAAGAPSTATWQIDVPRGTYYVRIKAEQGGVDSAWADGGALHVNRKPQEPTSLAPNIDRWVATNTPTLTWTFVDPDGNADSQSAFEIQVVRLDDSPIHSTGKEFSDSDSYTLPLHNPVADSAQSYKWRVRTWDEDGVVSVWSRYAFFKVDATAPTGTITLANGASYTTNPNRIVALTLEASDATSGVRQMRFSNDDQTWSAWVGKPGPETYTLPEGDGPKTVYVQFQDHAGNVSSDSDTIILDTEPPSGTVTINTGDEATNDPNVTLALTATDTGTGVAKMRFSLDGNTWDAWEPYDTEKSYTLTGADGLKTVYVQFRDAAQHVSSSVSSSIELDTVAPTVQVTGLGAYQTNREFDVAWRDTAAAGSGIKEVTLFYSVDGGTTWLAYDTTSDPSPIPFTAAADGEYVFAVTAVDKAGNAEAAPSGPGSVEGRTHVDTRLPSTALTSLGDYQTDTSFNLSWEGEDHGGSGVATVQLYYSLDNGTTWTPYGTPTSSSEISFTATVDGTYAFSMVGVDRAGNTEAAPSGAASVKAHTMVDTTKPTITVADPGDYQAGDTFDIVWLGNDQGGSGVAHVKLYYSVDGGITWTQFGTTFNSSPISFDANGDGLYAFILIGRDLAGNEDDAPPEGAPHQVATFVDTKPPTASVLTTSLAEYQTAWTFDVPWEGTDPGGSGIDYVKLYYSINGGFTWTKYENGGIDTFTVSPIQFRTGADGMIAFSVVAVDKAGNPELAPNGAASIEASTKVDTEAPQNPSIQITGGAAITATRAIALSLSATDVVSGMGSMRFSLDGGRTWDDWETYATEKSYQLPASDGPYTVTVQFRDKAGHASATASASILLDATPPTAQAFGLSEYTLTEDFLITWDGDDGTGSGIDHVLLYYSTDHGATWQRYGTTHTTSPIPFEAPAEGAYAFHVVAVDRAGNVETDAIIVETSTVVDITAPVTELAELESYQASRTFDVAWSGDDGNGSGIDVVKLYYSVDNGATWEQYETTHPASPIRFTADADGSYGFAIVGVDKVGREEAGPIGLETSTVVDTTAPDNPSILINNGAASTTSGRVTLTLSASDAQSGVVQMRFSTDGELTWSAWEDYATTRSFPLTRGTGSKTIHVQFRDRAGNESAAVSATITRRPALVQEPPQTPPPGGQQPADPGPNPEQPGGEGGQPGSGTPSQPGESDEVRVNVTVTGAPPDPAVLAALTPPGRDGQIDAVAVGVGEIEAALAAAERDLAPGAAATAASVIIPVTGDGNQKAVVLDASGVEAVVAAGADVVVQTPYATLVIPSGTVAQVGGSDPSGRMVVLIEDLGDEREDVSEQVTEGFQRAVSPVVEITLATVYPDGSMERHHQMRVPITLALPYDPTQVDPSQPLGIYLLLEDENGQVIGRLYVGGTADPTTGTVSVDRPTLSKYVVLAARTYVDVPASHWAHNDIYTLTLREVVNGVTFNTYEPEREVTRAEFATMLVRALGLPAAPEALAQFSDVEPGAWYVDTLGAAVKAGLFQGYTDGTLKPQGRISREEMATVLARLLEQRYGRTALTQAQADSLLVAYADGGQATWSRGALAQVVQSGLMKGRSATELAPQGVVTRAEATAMIRRMLDLTAAAQN